MLEVNFDDFVVLIPDLHEKDKKYQNKCFEIMKDKLNLSSNQYAGRVNQIVSFCKNNKIPEIILSGEGFSAFVRLRNRMLLTLSGHIILYWLISEYPEYTEELETSLWEKPFLEFYQDQKDDAAKSTAVRKKQPRKQPKARKIVSTKLSVPTAPFSWPQYFSEEDIKDHYDTPNKSDSGIWLSPHNHHSIPLFGRDDEQKVLDGFINAPGQFLICAIVASSGAGKTRLVSEWMKPYVAGDTYVGWDAGIVKKRDVSVWENWEITRNTLIVIDYTYNYDDVVKAIIERCQHQSRYQVRLLVVDHIYPEKIFNDITWRKSAPNGSEAAVLQKNFFYKSSPIELEGEKSGSKMLRHIIASVASLGEDEFSSDDERVRIAAELKILEMFIITPLRELAGFGLLMCREVY